MSAKSVSRLGSSAIRRSLQSIRPQSRLNGFTSSVAITRRLQPFHPGQRGTYRAFHASRNLNTHVLSGTEVPKESEPSERPTVPTDISSAEYNQRADEFLDALLAKIEQMQETRPEIDVEYSAGVMEISLQGTGTYVLNKQPPNKQIWLSSPVSGPKRYDWVVVGEGLHQKQDAGKGEWIYLRDGTSLTEIIRKELGVDLDLDDEAPQ
ncbi:Frataxin [Westerdykella ornata]|uniref:ferroxidase n=1 Tax=Westerdykella ornata TaxID=318751 RepID=A0A6A6JBA2_WESOR|nr:Frataxin [Westerdykella ornata]KAF2272906.1 Frataxin [Westerdykella ornata]